MVVERSQFLDLRRSWANFGLSIGNVLTVLPATRVRAVCRSHKRECVLNTIRGHLFERIGEQRVPVAITPVDRELWSMSLQLLFQCRNQISILWIDRTDAAEQLVMMCNLEHAFTRDVATSQHVLEEGNDIVHPFGPAERDK